MVRGRWGICDWVYLCVVPVSVCVCLTLCRMVFFFMTLPVSGTHVCLSRSMSQQLMSVCLSVYIRLSL